MPVEIKVRSNVGSLSATRLHEALVKMVSNTIRDSEAFLRADRALHSRKGLLEAHIEDEKAHELAGLIEGKLGVSPVIEADASRPTHGRFRRSQYPLFVEGGTRSPIFSPRGALMWNMREGIFGRREVRGQSAQHFMLKTFELAKELLKHDPEIKDALREMQARAAAEATAIRAR